MKTQKRNKALHASLWIIQTLIAMLMLWAAYAKLFQSTEELTKMLPWAAEHKVLVKFTGIIDLLGGLGLILPALLKILPKLTVYAAYGVVALMVAGSMFHISRGEASVIGLNIFMLFGALFIAWGRSKKAPIISK